MRLNDFGFSADKVLGCLAEGSHRPLQPPALGVRSGARAREDVRSLGDDERKMRKATTREKELSLDTSLDFCL